jgi:hypothetical protein
MTLDTTLFNKINNIIGPNGDMGQSKLLIVLLLVELLEKEKKLIIIFFGVTLKTGFKGLFFGALREILFIPNIIYIIEDW